MSGSRTGTVVSLNRSDGGVPKLPVLEARITRDGLEGDRQRNLKYHGGPDRALCLFSTEVIERIRGEGHPISAGSVGENVTIGGLDWRLLVPEVELAVGEVTLQVTAFTMPCRTISASFLDRRTSRISQLTHPGESRVYARVVRAGVARVGDPVVLR
jgi:MOSC domain-containing protein YiiM